MQYPYEDSWESCTSQMLKKKKSMKNQTEAGINFSLKNEESKKNIKKNSQTFFNIKTCPLVLSSVTFSYQTVSHFCYTHQTHLVSHPCCPHSSWWRCTLLQVQQKSHPHAGTQLLWMAERPLEQSNTAHRCIGVCSWAVSLPKPSLGK